MRLRPQPRAPLDGRHFDVVVIGGGINGVAIARECARGGRRTLLVEQNDFASGTTSRSTRIIHGGLRYLEHGEIGLVRESLRERKKLLAEHPHLIRPMQFVLALPSGRRSTMEVRVGLWLYRRCAGDELNRNSNPRALENLLDRHGDSLRLFTYDDAQCEFPERLVAEWLVQAMESGATVRNHTRALSIEITDGRVRGLRLGDLLRGNEYRVTTAKIINATGPWADAVCRESGVDTKTSMIGGIRGSHIVLPWFKGAPSSAVLMEAVDNRPVFLIPWNGQLLFGTTEVREKGDPGRVQPSHAEISYLRDSLRRLFAQAPVSSIHYAFAGVRPLPYAPGKNAAEVSRRHFLHDHAGEGAEGMISVIGGKLTTAASLARQCARQLGIAAPEPKLAMIVDPQAYDATAERFIRDVALIGGLTADTARALISRHGPRAVEIAHHIANDDRLRQPLASTGDHLLAEAMFAVQREAAVTLADVLLRRVPIALGPDFCDQDTRHAAARIGVVLGWTEQKIEQEIEDFELERAAFMVKPAAARLAA